MSYDFQARLEKSVNDLELGDDVLSEAEHIVEELLERDQVRRFTPYGGFDAMTGVSVYTAARQNRIPISPEKIENYFRDEDVFSVTKHFYSKKIREVNRDIVRNLDLENIVYKPSDFVFKARRDLDFSDEGWRMVNDLLDMVDDDAKELISKSPKAVAGASIYIVSILNSEGVTQKDINESLSLSDVAIRYTYKEIIESLTEISTEDFKLTDVEITATTLGLDGDFQ